MEAEERYGAGQGPLGFESCVGQRTRAPRTDMGGHWTAGGQVRDGWRVCWQRQCGSAALRPPVEKATPSVLLTSLATNRAWPWEEEEEEAVMLARSRTDRMSGFVIVGAVSFSGV